MKTFCEALSKGRGMKYSLKVAQKVITLLMRLFRFQILKKSEMQRNNEMKIFALLCLDDRG